MAALRIMQIVALALVIVAAIVTVIEVKSLQASERNIEKQMIASRLANGFSETNDTLNDLGWLIIAKDRLDSKEIAQYSDRITRGLTKLKRDLPPKETGGIDRVIASYAKFAQETETSTLLTPQRARHLAREILSIRILLLTEAGKYKFDFATSIQSTLKLQSISLIAVIILDIIAILLFSSTIFACSRAKKYSVLLAKLKVSSKQIQASEDLRKELMSFVGHEVKTPVTTILGAVQVLSDTNTGGEAQSLLQMIRRAAEDLRAMATNLLSLGRVEFGGYVLHTRPLHLTALIDTVIERIVDYYPDARARIQLTSDHTVACVDEELLFIALSNVISNAFRHSPQGSPVEIELKSENGRSQIAVCNSGQISPETLPDIFKPFKPTADKRGSGLGLYIAHEFIAAHRGEITAENLPDNRVRFVITL